GRPAESSTKVIVPRSSFPVPRERLLTRNAERGTRNERRTVAKTLTLGMLKPDAIESGKAGLIIALLQKEGFVFRAGKLTRLTKAQAAAFYEVHKGRPFYDELVAFMTSGPCFPMALEREDAVAQLRATI